MINLSFAAWVKFFITSKWTAGLITLICFLGKSRQAFLFCNMLIREIGVFYYARMHLKWGSFLAEKSNVSRPEFVSMQAQPRPAVVNETIPRTVGDHSPRPTSEHRITIGEHTTEDSKRREFLHSNSM